MFCIFYDIKWVGKLYWKGPDSNNSNKRIAKTFLSGKLISTAKLYISKSLLNKINHVWARCTNTYDIVCWEG